MEDAAERLLRELGENFPSIGPQQKRQMKDVELTASLLLLLEKGPQGYSASQLDEEFSERDDEWSRGDEILGKFDATIRRLKGLLSTPTGALLRATRLRNQADFYSLFGALAMTPDQADWERVASKLKAFIDAVADEQGRTDDPIALAYYEAARSASNDSGPRKTRIEILSRIIREAMQ